MELFFYLADVNDLPSIYLSNSCLVQVIHNIIYINNTIDKNDCRNFQLVLPSTSQLESKVKQSPIFSNFNSKIFL